MVPIVLLRLSKNNRVLKFFVLIETVIMIKSVIDEIFYIYFLRHVIDVLDQYTHQLSPPYIN